MAIHKVRVSKRETLIQCNLHVISTPFMIVKNENGNEYGKYVRVQIIGIVKNETEWRQNRHKVTGRQKGISTVIKKNCNSNFGGKSWRF